MHSKILIALLASLVRSVLAGPLVHAKIRESRVTYRGTTSDSIEHFQNIKYAHDTSGEQRFAPPEPFIPHSGSDIDATIPGPACPQMQAPIPLFFAETADMSEDCLSLRIARLAGTTPDAKLPVVVWIHGGGVVKGSASDPHSEPDNLIRLSAEINQPIIYVAIQFRITIFGFARLPTLRDQRSLNVGLRDQRAAFQWVKDNIEAFGGDPSKITAYGLSAGGTSMALHLMSYGGEKGVPFTQAWMMSGPPGTALNMSSDATEVHTKAVAEKLECKGDDDKAVLKCLREVPMEKLLSTAMEYSVANHPPAGLFTFIPSVDGDFFPDRQSVLYKTGHFVKGIPMVFGWTQNDGTMNTGPAHLIQSEDDMIPIIKGFAHALTTDDFNSLFQYYAAADFEQEVVNYEASKTEGDPVVPVHFFRLARILRDLLFTCSSIDFGYEMTKHSRLEKSGWSKVRLYDLNQTMFSPFLKGAGMPYAGVTHGSDTNYIFSGVLLEGAVSPEDQQLSRELTTAFINFAYTGDPNAHSDSDEEDWPPAFSQDMDLIAEDEPRSLSIQVIGGLHGTGAVPLRRIPPNFLTMEAREQQILGEQTEYGAMQSPAWNMRKAEVEKEKLFERCEFINGLAEKLGH